MCVPGSGTPCGGSSPACRCEGFSSAGPWVCAADNTCQVSLHSAPGRAGTGTAALRCPWDYLQSSPPGLLRPTLKFNLSCYAMQLPMCAANQGDCRAGAGQTCRCTSANLTCNTSSGLCQVRTRWAVAGWLPASYKHLAWSGRSSFMRPLAASAAAAHVHAWQQYLVRGSHASVPVRWRQQCWGLGVPARQHVPGEQGVLLACAKMCSNILPAQLCLSCPARALLVYPRILQKALAKATRVISPPYCSCLCAPPARATAGPGPTRRAGARGPMCAMPVQACAR